MKTRFDYEVWILADSQHIPVKQLETTHMMNIVRMLVMKPDRTMQMVISDVSLDTSCCRAWSPKDNCEVIKESIQNVTSMTAEDLIQYALNSNLGVSILKELESRGVNTANLLDLYLGMRE